MVRRSFEADRTAAEIGPLPLPQHYHLAAICAAMSVRGPCSSRFAFPVRPAIIPRAIRESHRERDYPAAAVAEEDGLASPRDAGWPRADAWAVKD